MIRAGRLLQLKRLVCMATLVGIALATSAAQSAWARTGYIAEVGGTGHSIARFDTTTNAVGGSYAVGFEQNDVVVSPDGSKVYASLHTAGAVARVDVASGAVTSIGGMLGTIPWGLALSPNGASLYVAEGNVAPGRIGVIDTASETLATEFQIAGSSTNISDVAVTPDGSRLYVAENVDPGAVYVLDAQAGTPVTTITSGIGAGPRNVAITPDGSKAYVANSAAGSVSVINTSTNTATQIPSVGLNPTDIAISPSGQRAYVSLFGGAGVAVIDTAMNAVATTITTGIGGNPEGLAFTPDGTGVYLAYNSFGSNPTAIDATTNTVSGSVPLGMNSWAVAITPDKGPTANFTSQAGTPGAPTTFDASASSDPDGTVARYDWNFGDGTALANGGATPTHTYGSPGSYEVTLTVTDNEGASTERVFTGHTVLRNGSAAARTQHTVTVPPAAADGAAPTVTIESPKKNSRMNRRRFKRASGTASDPSGVAKVEYAISTKVSAKKRKSAKKKPARCKHVQKSGKLSRPRSCKKVSYLTATGTTSWSAKIRKVLPRGKYTLYARATDTLGNVSEPAQVPFRLA